MLRRRPQRFKSGSAGRRAGGPARPLSPRGKLCIWPIRSLPADRIVSGGRARASGSDSCGAALNTPVDWSVLADGTLIPIIIGANLALIVYAARLAHAIHQRQTSPIGNLIVGNYEDLIFVGIGNAGMGLMKIRNLKASSKDGTADAEATISSFLKSADQIEGRIIASAERLTLVSFGFVPGSRFDDERRARIRNILKDITIELCYTDSKEKVEYTLTQDLALFGSRRQARA